MMLSSPFSLHWELYPRTYVVQRTTFPLIDHLDGDLDKEVWADVPWSDVFDDIRGTDAPEDERPNSSCRTQFKALWGEDHLYIAARLESDFETEAHFTERNSPIYHTDSDFEVFVDPLGDCQNYKELELNAINTVWNLMLDKPYADGGSEHSGRIAKPGDEKFYEVYGQKTATKVVKGKLNDPNAGATWSVEIALSYKDMMSHTNQGKTPTPGEKWRFNFSRVEKKGKTNWTWQPQIAWNPHKRHFAGFVDMHRPDAWGYFVFAAGEMSKEAPQRDLSWPSRLAAINVYYSQRAFKEKHEKYASKLAELSDFLNFEIIEPFDIQLETSGNGYKATVTGDCHVAYVNQDRHIMAETDSEASTASTI